MGILNIRTLWDDMKRRTVRNVLAKGATSRAPVLGATSVGIHDDLIRQVALSFKIEV